MQRERELTWQVKTPVLPVEANAILAQATLTIHKTLPPIQIAL